MQKNIELKTILSYLVLAVLTVVFLQQVLFPDLLKGANFLNWDAEHYHFIKDKGYKDFRVAFFPLFPLFWKLLSVSPPLISIINGLIYLGSFYLLIKELKIKSAKKIALLLSIPSSVFFFLPYSESLFFLFCVSIIIGLKKEKNYLVYLGLFLAILSRPAFTIFLPALVITELLSSNKAKIYRKLTAYFCIAMAGAAVVGYIQFLDTGEWFKFFQAQKGWGNKLQFPKLPLTSFAGGFSIRTDGFALLIGLVSGGIVTAKIFNLKFLRETHLPKEVLFSLCYLGGISLAVLMFRGGSLFSLNRFIFATPFIAVALHYWINKDLKLNAKKLLIIFGIVFSFWLLFNSYVHIKALYKYTLVSIYILLLFSIKSKNGIIKKYSFPVFIGINFIFQILFFYRFLIGEWVG